MIVSKRAVAEYLGRQLHAYNWMKRLTKRELLDELARLRTRPQFKTEPWLHQLVCFFLGLHEPRFLFLLDMGLGKSKIIQDLITQAQREKRLRRALIMVPRLINIDSWLDDLKVHSGLQPNPVLVESIDGKRDLLLDPDGDVSIIDYHGLMLALCDKKKGKLVPNAARIAHAQRQYNFFNADESHKLGNHDSLWFRVVEQTTESADYVFETTGTIFGRNPESIWSQFYIADRGETFGDTIGQFRSAFFKAETHPFKGQVFSFDKSKARLLSKMMRNRSLRYDEMEINDLPPCIIRPRLLDMAPEQREHYLNALEGVINGAGSPQDLEAPWIRMRQICSGYLKWKDDYGDHLVRFQQNPKLDMLTALLEQTEDSKVIVAYDYTETGRMICDHLKTLGIDHRWLYGGSKDRRGIREAFLHDPACQVLVMNSEAGGTGTDGFQHVAQYLFPFESPTPVITRKQLIKRVHRAGQKRRTFIIDLAMRDSVDTAILKSLQEGFDLYDLVVKGSAKKRRELLLGRA